MCKLFWSVYAHQNDRHAHFRTLPGCHCGMTSCLCLGFFPIYVCHQAGHGALHLPWVPSGKYEHTQLVRAVWRCTYCIIFRKWLGGLRSKVLCNGKTFLPPFSLGDRRMDSFLMLTLKQTLYYQKPFKWKCFILQKKSTPFLLAFLGRLHPQKL